MIGIYKITNLIDHKIYVGQSGNIRRRWVNHKIELNNNSHINRHLQYSWNKYGEKNFKFEIIEECSKSDLNDREKYWINYYNSSDRHYGFNIIIDPYHSVPVKLNWDKVHEIKKLLKNSNYNQVEIAERFNVHPDLIRSINAGRLWIEDKDTYPISGTRIIKRRNINLEKNKKQLKLYPVHSVNVTEFEAEINQFTTNDLSKKYKVSPKTIREWIKKFGLVKQKNIKSKPDKKCIIHYEVVQIDSQSNEVIRKFGSPTEAGIFLGDKKKRAHIRECCEHQRITAYGYKWEFKNKY